jgi:putative heme transporter
LHDLRVRRDSSRTAGAGTTPSRRKAAGAAAFAIAGLVGLYVLLPQVAGLDDTWKRLSGGDTTWLLGALVFEVLSYLSYVVLFRAVFRGLPLVAAYETTMAGVAATRLFAAGGAGGIALMAWALRRFGWSPERITVGMSTFYVLLYAVYMIALTSCGLALMTGALGGPAPAALTLIPAIFGALVILLVLLLALVPADLDAGSRHGRVGRLIAVGATRLGDGVRGAVALVANADLRVLGAVGWWAFDLAVLWACFQAFGSAPAAGVLVMAYFVGMLGNLLPVPGGVGGVDGSMIAAFIAFGVNGGLAVVAVFAYRAFAFWLPTLPGVIAYFQLRRDVKIPLGGRLSKATQLR